MICLYDEAFHQVAESDDKLKQKVDEVAAQEEAEQETTNIEENSYSEIETSSPDSDTKEENWNHGTDTEGLDQKGNEDLNIGFNPTQQHSITETRDSTGQEFLICCRISSADILLADRANKMLKKLHNTFQEIEVLNLDELPFDPCYLGNNVCVAALARRQLQFVDVRDNMKLTRSVDTIHDCYGLAYRNDQLYVIDDKSVYIYTNNGVIQRCLYTHKCNETMFRHIAVSEDSSKVYIACLKNGLVTIDSSGNCINTLSDPELKGTWGICVDDEGLVVINSYTSPNILYISSDGKQKVGKIQKKIEGGMNTVALCLQ